MKKNFINIVAAVSLVSITAASLAACGSSTPDATTAAASSEAATSEEATSASSDASGVIKKVIAHTQSYVPYDFIDKDGNHDGYEVAVWKAIDEKLENYEFEYVGTTDDDLLVGVESGKYNAGSKGVWWTEERSKKYVFPKNYTGASIIGIAIRKENASEITDLESFAKYSGKLVPIGPANAQYNIVENYNSKHPDAKIDLVAGDSFEAADAYQWVLEGRYDAYFNIKTSFEANVEKEDGEYHDFSDKLAFVPYEGIPIWSLFNKDEQQFADDFDKAFEELKADGTIESLQKQYFGYSLFDYVPEGYQKGDTL
ncbi:transporter substrate-binding domain-containing protein [Oribacterium sp. P6A1]|uniref:transporter substrate-binding domain-containing protein n=1 Tax=Oribacterium sp. P6A1 TaxID=1410612 RepID=UPI000A4D09CA|nr:transporter substrate-binding domain-containing protein [Oribacterium sp. P6A1]